MTTSADMLSIFSLPEKAVVISGITGMELFQARSVRRIAERLEHRYMPYIPAPSNDLLWIDVTPDLPFSLCPTPWESHAEDWCYQSPDNSITCRIIPSGSVIGYRESELAQSAKDGNWLAGQDIMGWLHVSNKDLPQVLWAYEQAEENEAGTEPHLAALALRMGAPQWEPLPCDWFSK